jgi:hypothetical protein
MHGLGLATPPVDEYGVTTASVRFVSSQTELVRYQHDR